MSADPSTVAPAGASHAVRIEVIFHTSDERHAQTVAAKLIDRAHEIANLPECECDVDVNVESGPPHSAVHRSSPLAPASTPEGSGGASPGGSDLNDSPLVDSPAPTPTPALTPAGASGAPPHGRPSES